MYKKDTILIKYSKVAISTILIIYCIEKFGNDLYSTSQDLENHISFASYISMTRDVSTSPYMANYPPVSHYIAAIASPFFGNLLNSFTKTSLIATILIYYILFFTANKYGIIHSVVACILMVITLHYGIGIIGSEVIGVFFYPQLLSSFLGILIINLIIYQYKFQSSFDFYLTFFIGAALGFFIHPTVMFIVIGAQLVKITSIAFISKYHSSKLIFNSILISFLTLLIAFAIPYNRMMSELALHNGWLSFGILADNTSITWIGYVFLLLSILISVVFIIRYSLKFDKNCFFSNYRIAIASVLFSGSFISIIHVLLVYLDKSTFYAVKKNFFFNATFLCMLCSMIVSDYILRRFPVKNKPALLIFTQKYSSIFALVISIIIVHILYNDKPSTSTYALDAIGKDCIKFQESKGFNARQRTITQLPINNVFNYVLTSSYLNFPNRQVLWDILAGKIDGYLLSTSAQVDNSVVESSFDYVISSSTELMTSNSGSGKPYNFDGLKIQQNADYIQEFLMPPSISPGEIIKMNTKKNIMVFQSGISPVEHWGTWSDGPHTRLQIKVCNANDRNDLILLIHPFIHGARSQFEAYAEINGKKKSLGIFSASNSSAQQIEIPFTRDDLDSLSKLTVDFYYTNTMPAFSASGLNSGDHRQLSFGFINISMRGTHKQ